MEYRKIIIATIFIWIGFVCAISFMEAWLKFRAPGITLPLGLGVGRIVFYALNKVEITLSIVIVISILLNKKYTLSPILFYISLAILLVQTFWLLPILDTRAEMHIQNKNVTPSSIHLYYVALEVLKVMCLLGYGIKLLKKLNL